MPFPHSVRLYPRFGKDRSHLNYRRICILRANLSQKCSETTHNTIFSGSPNHHPKDGNNTQNHVSALVELTKELNQTLRGWIEDKDSLINV